MYITQFIYLLITRAAKQFQDNPCKTRQDSSWPQSLFARPFLVSGHISFFRKLKYYCRCRNKFWRVLYSVYVTSDIVLREFAWKNTSKRFLYFPYPVNHISCQWIAQFVPRCRDRSCIFSQSTYWLGIIFLLDFFQFFVAFACEDWSVRNKHICVLIRFFSAHANCKACFRYSMVAYVHSWSLPHNVYASSDVPVFASGWIIYRNIDRCWNGPLLLWNTSKWQ